MCWILVFFKNGVFLWPFFSLSLGHLSPNYLSLQGQHNIPKYSTLNLACHGFPYLRNDGECPSPPAKNLFILPNLEKFPAVGSPPPTKLLFPPPKVMLKSLQKWSKIELCSSPSPMVLSNIFNRSIQEVAT